MFQNLLVSKVKFNDIEAINSINKALISQKIKGIKKNLNNFLKSVMLSKVKYNDLEAIRRSLTALKR